MEPAIYSKLFRRWIAQHKATVRLLSFNWLHNFEPIQLSDRFLTAIGPMVSAIQIRTSSIIWTMINQELLRIIFKIELSLVSDVSLFYA